MASFLSQLQARAPLAKRSAIVTIQILTTLHLITTDLLEIRLCSGFSMLPTFSHQGDFVLISPIPVKYHTTRFSASARGQPPEESTSRWGINRGDVVIATSPTDPSRTVCKRVMGMEGDVVEVDPLRKRKSRRRSDSDSDVVERRWQEVDPEHRSESARLEREKGGTSPQGRTTKHGEVLVPVFNRRKDGDHVRIPRGYVWLAGDNLSNSTDSRAYGPVPLALIKGKVLARVWPNPKWIDNPVRIIESSA